MPMPPALAAALAAKQGGSKKKNKFGAPAADAKPNPFAAAAQAKLAQKAPAGKKKGAVPPQFLK